MSSRPGRGGGGGGRDNRDKWKDAAREGKRSSQKEPEGGSKKMIVIGLGALLCVAGIGAIVVVIMMSPDPEVDFNASMDQFSGDIQLEENEDGFVTWSDEYSDLQSPKSRQLIGEIGDKLKFAIEAEGFSVDDVVIESLAADAPVDIERVEIDEDGAAGRVNKEDGKTKQKGERFKKFRTKKKKYRGIRRVRARFRTKGKPSKNAKVISELKDEQVPEVKKVLADRIGSTGLLAKVYDLHPFGDFRGAALKLIEKDRSEGTGRNRAPMPAFDPPTPCGCDETSDTLSVNNPMIVCSCPAICNQPNNQTEIYGGQDNRFACYGSPICATAFYSGVIQPYGGEVEVLYTGKHSLPKGPNKQGYDVFGVDINIESCTYKSIGAVVNAQLPADDESADNLNRFLPREVGLQQDPVYTQDYPFDGGEAVVIHTLINKVDGKKVTYKRDFANIKNAELIKLKTALDPKMKTCLGKFGVQYDELVLRHTAKPDSGDGMIFGFAVIGNSETIAANIARTWNGYNQFKIKVRNAFDGVATVLNVRFGRNVLAGVAKVKKG